MHKEYDVLDIETIPREDAPEPVFDPSAVPLGSAKKQDTINAKIADAKTSFDAGLKQFKETGTGPLAKKLSLNPLTGRVLSFAYVTVDEAGKEVDSEVFYADNPGEEQELLENVQQIMSSGKVVIGFNLKHFDLPFLWKRSILKSVPGVVPDYLGMTSKYRMDKAIDLMSMWTGFEGMISQDALCEQIGLPGKGEMDGSKVYSSFLKGEHEKIRQYNTDDCFTMIEIAKRFGILK